MEIEEIPTMNPLPASLVRLNIGCGANKIDGFINIDSFEGCSPDLVHDITKGNLPYENSTVDEIVFFHCIEHIEERLHDIILGEFWRVLRPDGKLVLSYPEFLKCAKYYEENFKGQRDFFKATIYGRQSHAGDFHVSLMDTRFFKIRLERVGFKVEKIVEESTSEIYNTLVLATKSEPWIAREDMLREEIFNY